MADHKEAVVSLYFNEYKTNFLRALQSWCGHNIYVYETFKRTVVENMGCKAYHDRQFFTELSFEERIEKMNIAVVRFSKDVSLQEIFQGQRTAMRIASFFMQVLHHPVPNLTLFMIDNHPLNESVSRDVYDLLTAALLVEMPTLLQHFDAIQLKEAQKTNSARKKLVAIYAQDIPAKAKFDAMCAELVACDCEDTAVCTPSS